MYIFCNCKYLYLDTILMTRVKKYNSAAIECPLSLKLVGVFNSLNPELNPICYLLVLLGAHHFLHVSRIRAKSLTPAEILGSNPTGGMDICLS